MEYAFNKKSWSWHDIREEREQDSIQKLLELAPLNKWGRTSQDMHTNFLRVMTRNDENEHIYGSLVYQQDIKIRKDKKIFHFYLDKGRFISVDFNLEAISEQALEVQSQLDKEKDAIDGFLIVLSEILTNYLQSIDDFEERLHNLIWKIQEQNNVKTLEQVYDTRHELLIWKNLIIPMKELKIGIEEAFGDVIFEKRAFKRFAKKLERAYTLIKEYQEEIDTMINLEEVVSSHRGNEIMKTLTVMTILFTPVAALGALWGMNFKFMPELKWQFGYIFAIGIILVSTLALYFYLRVKGWTGDILEGKKKHKYFE